MKLYNYFRSSASFRVRIALEPERAGLRLPARAPGQGRAQGKTPTPPCRRPTGADAGTDDGTRLSQSMAIIEYLDETHPGPALLPKDPLGRPGCGRWRSRSPAKSTR
jgi:glutathione S-transferase